MSIVKIEPEWTGKLTCTDCGPRKKVRATHAPDTYATPQWPGTAWCDRHTAIRREPAFAVVHVDAFATVDKLRADLATVTRERDEARALASRMRPIVASAKRNACHVGALAIVVDENFTVDMLEEPSDG